MKTKATGQTLVLFALTLMLLTLLVLMTLSFGSKVKSRMEVQTVADATAYSNAVATARTMNSIAVMNRVNVAHTVSTIGTISLISWVTLYFRHAENGAKLWMWEMIAMIAGLIWCICPSWICDPVACSGCKWGIGETALAMILMMKEAKRVKQGLLADTNLFINETTPRWMASQAIWNDQGAMVDTLRAKLNSPANTFTKTYASAGNLRGVTALDAPKTLNSADLDNAVRSTPATAPWGLNGEPYHASQVVNASRGHLFTPRRTAPSGIGSAWAVKLSWWQVLLAAGWVFSTGKDTGRGYVNNTWVGNIPGPALGHPYGIWAQDWGGETRALLIKLFSKSCKIFGMVALAIGLVGLPTGNNVKVGPFDHPLIHNGVQHSYYTFPPFYDYNPAGTLADTDDIYAMPKNMSMVSADPTQRRDAWETRGTPGTAKSFNFKFGKTGTGAALDMGAEPASSTGGMQNAVGSGVTYYSRPGHFEEPPNLFAPYWRAGLSRMTVDRPAAGGARMLYDNNLKQMFTDSTQGEAATAFQELVNSGYKGFE